MKGRRTILDNANGLNETFLGQLHEESKIDLLAFKKLMRAFLQVATEDVSVSEEFSAKVVADKALLIYAHTARCCIAHLDSNDSYKISNPPTNFSFMLERLMACCRSIIVEDGSLIQNYYDEYGSLAEFNLQED